MLGAGGAARAVVFGLIERGVARIDVANRTIERARRRWRQRFGARRSIRGGRRRAALFAGAGLLVNTTSLGMKGQPALAIASRACRQAPWSPIIVYVPLVTPLLAAARARGLRTADGLGMLLHQAVRGFSLWFGVRPQVTPELRALVEADLAQA